MVNISKYVWLSINIPRKGTTLKLRLNANTLLCNSEKSDVYMNFDWNKGVDKNICGDIKMYLHFFLGKSQLFLFFTMVPSARTRCNVHKTEPKTFHLNTRKHFTLWVTE